MSNLDEQMISVLKDQKTPPQEKYQTVQRIFAAHDKMIKINPKYALNEEAKDQMASGSFASNLPLIGTAVLHKNSWEIIQLFIDRKYKVDAALYVALETEYLAKEILIYVTAPISLTKGDYSSKKSSQYPFSKAYQYLQCAISQYKKMCATESESKEIKDSARMAIRMTKNLSMAFREDSDFVLKFMMNRLHAIRMRRETEKNAPYLWQFTQILFDIVNNKISSDSKMVKNFEEDLLKLWYGYEPSEAGFFKSNEELRENLDPYLKDTTHLKCFSPAETHAEISFSSLQEIKEKPDTQLIPRSSGFFRRDHEKKGDYIARFMSLNENYKRSILEKHAKESKNEGFNIVNMLRTLLQIAPSFGIDNKVYEFELIKPEIETKSHSLIDQLSPSLRKDASIKYLLFVIQTNNGGHAVAAFIDRVSKVAYCVDPGGNYYKGHDIAEARVKELMKFEELAGGRGLIVPKAYTDFPQKHAPDQDRFCAVYATIILLALLCKHEKIVLSSKNEKINTVLKTLEIDVENSIFPKSEYLDEYLGALLLAHSDFNDLPELDRRIRLSPMMKPTRGFL